MCRVYLGAAAKQDLLWGSLTRMTLVMCVRWSADENDKSHSGPSVTQSSVDSLGERRETQTEFIQHCTLLVNRRSPHLPDPKVTFESYDHVDASKYSQQDCHSNAGGVRLVNGSYDENFTALIMTVWILQKIRQTVESEMKGSLKGSLKGPLNGILMEHLYLPITSTQWNTNAAMRTFNHTGLG